MIITNKYNLPEFFVKAVEHQFKSHESEAEYSITELINAPRVHRLQLYYKDKIQEDAAETVWAILGSATHKVIEDAFQNDVADRFIAEERLYDTLDGVTYSGAFDLYDKVDRTIYDLKTTGWYEIQNPDNAISLRKKKEQTEQLNCYAYLARKLKGYKVDKLVNVKIMRDWTKGMAERGVHPPHQVVLQSRDVWPDQVVEDFLINRIRIHEESKIELPYCTQEEQWRNDPEVAIMNSADRRRAVKASLKSEQEALTWIEQNKYAVNKKTGRKYLRPWVGKTYIETRPSAPVRCESYCSVKPFCSQYRNML
tara:strand:- start:586 stop:1515 length:930 start_codon:yes stop_codon:yes gene_type:complete